MTVPPPATVDPVETGMPAWATPEAVEIRRRRVRDAADRTLGRRRLWGRIMKILCMMAVVVGLAPLVAMLWATIARGASLINGAFLTNPPTPSGVPGGGISTAITGSAEIVGLALLIAIPLGLFVALFLHERPGRLASSVRFCADVLAGVPSIIVGIFAYAVLVKPLHHASTLAAGFAIAVLMVPIMIRANEEAMRAVPVDLWEAGVSLGIRRSRVARSIVLRGALPGLVSGNLLAIARAVGETAPLLFTVAAPTLAMTLLIFNDATEPFTSTQQVAWATALVLLAFVLILSIVARTVAWALNRKAR